MLGKRGAEVAKSIAEGRAEIGTTFISEVLPLKGVKVVGPLPGDLHNANTYTAAIPAGSAQQATRAGLAARAHRSGDRQALDRGRARAGLPVNPRTLRARTRLA